MCYPPKSAAKVRRNRRSAKLILSTWGVTKMEVEVNSRSVRRSWRRKKIGEKLSTDGRHDAGTEKITANYSN